MGELEYISSLSLKSGRLSAERRLAGLSFDLGDCSMERGRLATQLCQLLLMLLLARFGAFSLSLRDTDRYSLHTRGGNVQLLLSRSNDTLLQIKAPYNAWFRDEVTAANSTGLSFDQATGDFVEALLFKGGGELCSACKTAVEEVALQLETVRTRMDKIMPGLVRAEELSGNDAMSRKILSNEFKDLCNEGNYRDLKYSREYRRGCFLILGSHQFQSVFGEVDSEAPSWVPEMKRKLCTLETQVCHRKRRPPVTMSQCRQCAENMQDLSYVLRRASRTGYREQKAVSDNAFNVSFLGTDHWKLASETVCETTKLRHPASVASDLEEHCVDTISEHDEAMRAKFIPSGGVLSHSAPREVCTEVTKDCSTQDFDEIQSVLESWHLKDHNETGKVGPLEAQMFRREVARSFNRPGTQSPQEPRGEEEL